MKRKNDCALDDTSVSVTLTQEETLKFKAGHQYQIQVRALTVDGESIASDVITENVEYIIDDDEVLV